MLLRLKFHGQPAMGRVLGELLASHPGFADLTVDMVAPMPLHPRRLAVRGYNQALEIARSLARSLRSRNVRTPPELSCDCLRRIRFSRPQEGLTREERIRNTEAIFQASPAASGKRVLLVDDVLTTGATLTSACNTLLRAGAISVGIAVVARTPRTFPRHA
jgi:ComF family protein